MTTTSEIYAQSELSKKLIEEIANDIKATAERLYNDMNNSPLHTQYKVGLHETATWQKDHVTPKVLTSTPVDPLHKASDHIVIQKSVTPITTFSGPLHKQTEILSKPISGHVRSPSAHNANKKFDELIAKADLIISRSPRRDNYSLKTDAKPVPFDFSNLKTLPKSPVVASAFTETYNGSAKPGHTRHVSSGYEDVKIGDYLSGADIHRIKTEYQPVQIALTTPKDYKEEYKASTNILVSSHDYKSTPVYTDKLGAYQYETSGHKHLDVYKSAEPKKEVAYQYGSGSKQENKYYDHGKLDVVIGNIAKRKGTSPEALKSSPKPHLKIVTEANPNYYYTGHQNLPEYIDRAGETFTQPATISLDNYKLSSQLNQYEGLYQSNKPAHAEYGAAGNKLNDPYGLSLSKLVERATLESGYSSALIRDDYNSMLLESKAPKKTLGYEPRSARSPERSIIERVEALENDLDSLYFDVNNTGRFGNGTNRELDRPVQSLGGYQGLYKGRNEEYGHEIETRHKSPYGGNEGLVYVRDLDKRRLHQGESNQGGVHVSNKERFVEEDARGVRREGNTWREEDRYRIQVTAAQPAQRERSYDTTGYRAYDDRREELARKSYERRDLTPESYRREYGDNVNRYSPPRSNLRSPIRYTNKTEQVTPTKSPGSRQGSGQKGTNKIERAFHF